MSAILLSGATKSYGSRVGLHPTDLRIDGGIVGLIGPNGAGKSTFLGLVSGALVPTRGTVEPGRDGGAALAAQDAALPSTIPVGTWLSAAAADGSGMPPAPILAALGLDAGVLASPWRALSHGTAVRVAVAHAVLGARSAILLDEPMSGLDPDQSAAMRSFIGGLRTMRMPVIVSSHALDDVSACCDEVIVIRSGRVAARGPATDARRLWTETSDVHH